MPCINTIKMWVQLTWKVIIIIKVKTILKLLHTHTHYDNVYVHITIGDELWCGLAGHQKILVPFLSQNFKFNLASLSHPYGFVKKGMYHCNIDLEYC